MNFSQYLDAAHISTLNCDEMAGGKRRRASKTATLLKSGYFTAIIACSVILVADRHRHAAYHNKHW